MKKYRTHWTLEKLQPFITELKFLLAAGLPLLSVLKLLEENYQGQAEYSLTKQLQQKIHHGISFAKAWQECTQENLSASLIFAGEEAGMMIPILKHLEEYAKNSQKLRHILWQAMRYPLFLLGLTIALLSMLCIWVVPQFASLYENFNIKIPALTKIILHISQATQDNFIFIMLFIGGLSTVLWASRYQTWLIKLKNKLFFYRHIGELRFFQVLGLLLKSGIPILQALKLANISSDDKKMQWYIEMMIRELQRGESLSKFLIEHPYFPTKLISLIRLAEASGDLSHMLETYTQQQTEILHLKIQSLKTWLEPIFLCIIGSIIGCVLIALYLPMVELGKNM